MPSPQWKRRARGEAWFPGDTVNIGIGQGAILATPIQLATAVAAIANRGIVVTPHLLAGTQNPVTNEIDKYQPPANKVSIVARQPEYWDVIINAMVEVVQGVHGTARPYARSKKYVYGGKTGTAQVYSLPSDDETDDREIPMELRDHALFIAFAPAENPVIAISVVVEHGEHGSSGASPIARRLVEYWLSRTESK